MFIVVAYFDANNGNARSMAMWKYIGIHSTVGNATAYLVSISPSTVNIDTIL